MTAHDNDTGTERARASEDERLAVVEKHVHHENQHDLDGIMATFGEHAWYDVEPLDEHHDGRNGGRTYYEDLLQALPDLHIDIHRRHVTDESVILETIMSGTHNGVWRGLPGTGREVEFPVCAVFEFDTQNTIAGERIYYDRATVLRQLGIFHDPERGIGQILTPLTHPVTMIRALTRTILRR